MHQFLIQRFDYQNISNHPVTLLAAASFCVLIHTPLRQLKLYTCIGYWILHILACITNVINSVINFLEQEKSITTCTYKR